MRTGVSVQACHCQVLLPEKEKKRKGRGCDRVSIFPTLLMVEKAGLQVVDRHLSRSISSRWDRAVCLPSDRGLAVCTFQVDRTIHWKTRGSSKILQSLVDDVLDCSKLLTTPGQQTRVWRVPWVVKQSCARNACHWKCQSRDQQRGYGSHDEGCALR